MDNSSDKKHHRKQPKDSDSKKRPSSSSSYRYDPQVFNRSSASSSSSHPSSSSSTDPTVQRKHHWETVMLHSSDPSTPLDRSHPFFKHSTRDPTSFSANFPLAPPKLRKPTSSHPKSRHQPNKPPLRAVPIAPSGPIIEPREENDGYRFKCTEEGCEQRFRHRSSRSRHKKNCHMRNANKTT